MPTRTVVRTSRAPPPLPFYSQAIVCGGMVYCSGSIGMSPETKAMVEGGIADRTVSLLQLPPFPSPKPIDLISDINPRHTNLPASYYKTQCLENLTAVLEEAGSSLQNCVKVNVFLTDMANFAAMNKVYDSFFQEPKPVRGILHLD